VNGIFSSEREEMWVLGSHKKIIEVLPAQAGKKGMERGKKAVNGELGQQRTPAPAERKPARCIHGRIRATAQRKVPTYTRG